MKEITLEHLAPYLPYGVKFYVFDDPSFEKKYLEKYPNGNSRVVITIDNFKDKIFKDGYKPILRPLSDLTNEIEVSKCKDYFHFTKNSRTVKIGRFENRINVLTLLNKNFKTNIQ